MDAASIAVKTVPSPAGVQWWQRGSVSPADSADRIAGQVGAVENYAECIVGLGGTAVNYTDHIVCLGVTVVDCDEHLDGLLVALELYTLHHEGMGIAACAWNY